MDEIVEDIKEEMDLLDDKEKGVELRKELGVDGLNKIDLYRFKIDFIVNHIGYKNLYGIEKNEYLQKLVPSCINEEELFWLFNIKHITCVTPDHKLVYFHVYSDIDDKFKSIYYICDQEATRKISTDEIKGLFANGMRTLSNSNRKEFERILLENVEEDKRTAFTSEEIGKATNGILSKSKNEAEKEINSELDKKRGHSL